MAVTFDTLELAKKLEAAGFSETQAEGLASSLSHIQSRQLEALATKDDLYNTIRATKDDLHNTIQATKDDLRITIKDLEIEVERRIDGLEAQITLLKWMMGFLLAGVTSLIVETFF